MARPKKKKVENDYNPFAVDVKEKQEDERPVFDNDITKPTELIVGRPSDDFNSSELDYLTFEMKKFKDIIARNPATEVFVNELLLAQISLQRHDVAASRELKACADPKEKADLSVKQDKQRAMLFHRFYDACEALGILPKELSSVEDKESDCIAVMHKRYLHELNERRKQNWKVGEVGPEAEALAKEHGIDVVQYKPEGVMPELVRANIISEYNEELGVSSDDAK